jgi:hypothetical protein
VFWSVFFRASGIWLKSSPDFLPSYDVLVLETDWWRRLSLPAVDIGCSSLGLLPGKVCEIFEGYFLLFGICVISNFVHRKGLY